MLRNSSAGIRGSSPTARKGIAFWIRAALSPFPLRPGGWPAPSIAARPASRSRFGAGRSWRLRLPVLDRWAALPWRGNLPRAFPAPVCMPVAVRNASEGAKNWPKTVRVEPDPPEMGGRPPFPAAGGRGYTRAGHFLTPSEAIPRLPFSLALTVPAIILARLSGWRLPVAGAPPGAFAKWAPQAGQNSICELDV
jgi:hypothetical protein